MVNREVIGAHYGLSGWLMQRVTAAIMLVYTLFFLAVMLRVPKFDYWHWKVLWQVPVMRYATVLFIGSLLVHAWFGARSVLMDYVHATGMRLTLYVVVVLALTLYGAWAVQILWSL